MALFCFEVQAADTKASAKDGKTLTLGVLLFPGFELLDAYGPLELWGNMKQRVSIVTISQKIGPISSAQGPQTVATHDYATAPPLDLLLVPGGFGAFKALQDETTLSWLRERSGSARLTMSVCNGASILAAAGLLDGRPATTNKAYWKAATRYGNNVKWVPQARWVDDGSIVTSSGVSAGIDMTLHVISRLFTLRLAEKMADEIEHEWHRDSSWDPFAVKNGLVPAH
ncbi:DJ-1/PfpI family protein [Prosthecobacter fusiformis]|nr:DJ-1/PfpI family protein [Prosthecobacter fusiformis]